MARESIDWSRLDRHLRRMARTKMSVKRQARELKISPRSITARRAFLGLSRPARQQENSHV